MQPDQNNREVEGAMVFEQRRTHGILRGVVRRLTQERTLQEDLTQEAIIHLWLREKERPGQSQSWYIQSCRFYLQNLLRKGRSIDSGKHRPTAALRDGDGEDEEQEQADWGIHDTLFALVCARDLASELSKWLSPVEKQVFNLGVDGLSLREIAVRIGLSHTTVNKYRRNIASLASRLGLHESSTPRLKRLSLSAKPNPAPTETGRIDPGSSPHLTGQLQRAHPRVLGKVGRGASPRRPPLANAPRPDRSPW
jgi:RNA polymerase sigma factor (sigma-70 family)